MHKMVHIVEYECSLSKEVYYNVFYMISLQMLECTQIKYPLFSAACTDLNVHVSFRSTDQTSTNPTTTDFTGKCPTLQQTPNWPSVRFLLSSTTSAN